MLNRKAMRPNQKMNTWYRGIEQKKGNLNKRKKNNYKERKTNLTIKLKYINTKTYKDQ
jgi:hypothetical protein